MDTLETLKTTSDSQSTENIGPAEAYINWLRTDFARGRWSADPEQPCLLYKTYQGAERIYLDGNIPLQLGKDFEANWGNVLRGCQVRPEQKLSWLLYFTHGLTRRVRPVAGKATSLGEKKQPAARPRSGRVTGPTAHFSPALGRPVPSGGNLHPVEIYLAVNKDWGLQPGLYHYDSAHHSLDLLRAGDFLSAIAACLPDGKTTGSAVVLLANCIQKNYQKYTSLSYLLQTLDAGIVLEQLCFVATRLELFPAEQGCFRDYPLHALCGLNPEEEPLYALLTLHQTQQPASSILEEKSTCRDSARRQFHGETFSARPVQPFVPARPVALLQDLYAASLLNVLPESSSFAVAPRQSDEEQAGQAGEITLPEISLPHDYDLAQVLLRRHTSSQSLDTRELTLEQLAAILHFSGRLERPLWQLFNCQIYCVASRVLSLPQDAYLYSRERHALKPLSTPSLIPLLIRLSAGSNIHPYLPPVVLFFCGDYQQAHAIYGERGLRLLGIEIGRMVQDIALCTAHCGLGTHVHVSTALDGIRTRLLGNFTQTSLLPFATIMIGQKRNAEENLFEALWY